MLHEDSAPDGLEPRNVHHLGGPVSFGTALERLHISLRVESIVESLIGDWGGDESPREDVGGGVGFGDFGY